MKLLKKWNGGKILGMQLHTYFYLFIKTVSEANSSEHWSKKHARHKLQKHAIKSALRHLEYVPKFPVHVKFIRQSPRLLDKHDNLPMSFKYLYDAFCDYCIPGLAAGRADDTDQITVEYDQTKSKNYSIFVEIYHK